MMRPNDWPDLLTWHQGEADLVICNNKGHQKKTWQFSDCNISVQSASTGCRGSNARSHLLEGHRWLHFCWFPNYNVVALQRKIDRLSSNTHHIEADHWGKHNIKQLHTIINSQPASLYLSISQMWQFGDHVGFLRVKIWRAVYPETRRLTSRQLRRLWTVGADGQLVIRQLSANSRQAAVVSAAEEVDAFWRWFGVVGYIRTRKRYIF